MALNKGDAYGVIGFRNGHKIEVECENVRDLGTTNMTHHHGWVSVNLLNGKEAQIWAEDISYISVEVY